MALHDGVLRAQTDRANREGNQSSPHVQIWALDSTGAGPDPGREIVVLGNCPTATRSPTGRQVIGRNGRVTVLRSRSAAGLDLGAARRHRCATGPQRGNVVLQGNDGNRVDSVTDGRPGSPAAGPLRLVSAATRTCRTGSA